MKRQSKKAFTVIELVIVIAVVAILAAVLIPTIVSVIDQANSTMAQSELRDIQITVEMKLALENPWEFTDGETKIQIHRNADGTLWAKYGDGNSIPLDIAFDLCPDFDGYGKFTLDSESKSLIYTRKGGNGSAIWSGIVGEPPIEPPQNEPEIESEHQHKYIYGECRCGAPDPEHPEHNYDPNTGKCDCGKPDPNYTPPESTEPDDGSNGIIYMSILDNDGRYYVKSVGSCTDTEIKILDFYKGHFIVAIGQNAFSGCQDVTKIELPNTIMEIRDYAFSSCENLEEINLPSTINKIGLYAFYGCESLENIDLPDNIEIISKFSFTRCTRLTNIAIPNKVTSIGDMAFAFCSDLESVTFDENTSVDIIDNDAFLECTSLKTIEIPNTVWRIDNFAFYGCTSLESITIPTSSDMGINAHTFTGCTSLTTVNISTNVKEIKVGAFDGCTALQEIKFSGTVAQWQAINKESGWDTNTGEYVINCDDGTITKTGEITYDNNTEVDSNS